MRNITLLLVILLLCSCERERQFPKHESASGFSTDSVTEGLIDNIELLSHVWGYVKYHHPAFHDEKLDADTEFLSLLKKTKNNSHEGYVKLLDEWVVSLGNCRTNRYKGDDLICLNNFEWILDTLKLGVNLSGNLNKMRFARRGLFPPYVSQSIGVIYKENGLENLDIKSFDAGYRLLGVARFYNHIECFSPNRNITDAKWDDVLHRFILMALDREVPTDILFAKLISALNDTHAQIYTSILGTWMVPAATKFAEGRLFVTDSCSWGDVRFEPGDEIIAVNGEKPADRIDEISEICSYSNRAALMRDASYKTLLLKDSIGKVQFVHDGKIIEVEQTLPKYSDYRHILYETLFSSSKEPLELLSDSVAVLNIGTLKSADCDSIFDIVKSISKLIIDMRAYPDDFDVKETFIGRHLCANKINAGYFIVPKASRPGYFQKIDIEVGDDNVDSYKGRIVLLVNAQTQSRGEFFTMILQALPNTVTVGSQTAGADGNVTRVLLPYGFETSISSVGVYYPDGVNAQRAGVKIDYLVEPSAEDMVFNRDVVMRKALEI